MSDSNPVDGSSRSDRFRFGLLTLMLMVTALSILFAVPYGASFIAGIVYSVATVVLLFGALLGVQYPVFLLFRRVLRTRNAADGASARVRGNSM